MTRFDRFAPILLAILLLSVYGITLAPGLTWANRGADGGDLIAAAATNGVPHPSGYPVYIFLARLFQHLPVGSLAFRTNLLSALMAAFTSALTCKLVSRISQNASAGFVSGLAFGFSPLFWSQAVITEVYTLHAFFVTLILFLFAEETKSDPILGLTFGLAMGNHVTSIFLLPLVFVSANRSSLLRRIAWTGAGLLSYIILPLRALAHPPVNWGNPVTLENFLWLVTARLYQNSIFALTWSGLATRLQSAAAFLLDQFGVFGLILSMLGLFLFFRRPSLSRATLWITATFFVFALIYSTDDSYLYLIPLVLSFAIWLGFGVDGLMRTISGQRDESPSSQRESTMHGLLCARYGKRLSLAFGFFVMIYLFILAAFHFPGVDASHDARAEQFGTMVMARMPADAVVFAKGDEAVFALWYFHYGLGQRPDLAVIAADLLHFGWYQQTLKETYPSLIVNSPYPFPETIIARNPKRPTCFVEFDGQARIRCNP